MSLDVCSRRCGDDRAEYNFKNGARLHYHFAGGGLKRIEDALGEHDVPLSSYDVVFANPGNEPYMTTDVMLESARALKTAGVPLFWSSTYDGVGDIQDWNPTERAAFAENGVRFIPIHSMVQSLRHWTKGKVESNSTDTHFCLPGPPSEIGMLLLRIAWALHFEAECDGSN